ncbi:MAG: PAS domain-containing protein [Planctomycetota bacterium]|nr:PAS domain-containing protein [Planctomycetota bacterium]
MGEHNLLESVDQARSRLGALLELLATQRAAENPAAFADSLSELRALFDQAHSRCGLLRNVLDHSSEIVFAKHADGRYALINLLGAQLLGKPAEQVIGLDDRALVSAPVAQRRMAIDAEVMRTGEPTVHEERVGAEGSEMTLKVTTSRWLDSAGRPRGVIGIAQDITDVVRKDNDAVQQQQRMRALATESMLADERLRLTLATELQSGLGQDIALARMKLARLREGAGAELHGSLGGIEELIEQADLSLRSVAARISPPALHDLGLVAALGWLAEDMSMQHGLAVRIEADGAPEITEDRVRVILHRAIRELLSNVVLHSCVRSAVVRIDQLDSSIRIVVHDEGVGFDAKDHERRGYGLRGIDEQLQYIGGALQVESSPASGTEVTITAPLYPAPAIAV